MAETTDQYKNRISQIKTSIENEPEIVKMREDIAEGISKTGNRQADIEVRQGTLEEDFVKVQQDASSASPSGAEVAVARGEYPTLDGRLTAEQNKVNAQLAQTAIQVGNQDDLNIVGENIPIKLRNEFSERGINVSYFGAIGDAFFYDEASKTWYKDEAMTIPSTDNTIAFEKAFQFAFGLIKKKSILESNPFGQLKIFVPPGSFLVKGKNLMSDAPMRFLGMEIEGALRYGTRIVYQPNSAGDVLFKNDDKIISLKFSNIAFYGEKEANFLLSHSTGGAQLYTFEDCHWKNWNKVTELTGTNNNSEFVWNKCTYSGVIKKGLFVGVTNTSDQFLNYSFNDVNFQVEYGDFIDMAKGGNINVKNGSFLHTGDLGGCFFILRGNTHYRGVQRLDVQDIRIEHRKPASKLIECGWGQGNVDFRSVDSVSSEDGTMDTVIRASFNAGNEAFPIINFQSSQLAGKHEYVYNSESYNYPKRIKYDGCNLYAIKSGQNLDSFVSVINGGSGNVGGQPVIRFVNCRDGSNDKFFVDSDYNGMKTNVALLSPKILKIANPNGYLPAAVDGILRATLPMGAIITKVRLYIKPGSLTSAAHAKYFLRTEGDTPSFTYTFDGERLSDGMDLTAELMYLCDTLQSTKLMFYADTTVNASASKGYLLVEYLG